MANRRTGSWRGDRVFRVCRVVTALGREVAWKDPEGGGAGKEPGGIRAARQDGQEAVHREH